MSEVAAKLFGLRIGLGERPTVLRVGALRDGVVTFKERRLRALELFGDVEGDFLLTVAVVVDDQRVVPVVGDVDAVGGAVQYADFGGADGGLQDGGLGLGLLGRQAR